VDGRTVVPGATPPDTEGRVFSGNSLRLEPGSEATVRTRPDGHLSGQYDVEFFSNRLVRSAQERTIPLELQERWGMGLRVLVVDDSTVMRRIIIRSLNAVGVTDIEEAADGERAIQAFGESSFNLVLTDWNMPRTSGLDVVKAIRATGSEIPIIMVTTEAERARVQDAIAAGVTDYLAKPFEADKLRQKLARYVLL
jgi:two-component system, chemotaxis family, chemotaxis protein CheY